jgi:hypothetical protein
VKNWRTGVGVVLVLAALTLAPMLSGQMQETLDYEALYKIRTEGFTQQRSQVMEIMSYLTDVHGPRLTGSPQIKAAGEWSVKKLTEWGLVNAKLEPWTMPAGFGAPAGPGGAPPSFGRGWTNDRFYMQVTAPVPFPVIGYAKAWTPGTEGTVSGDAVLVLADREADLDQYKGKLKGKFVLTARMRAVLPSTAPLMERYTDTQLAELSQQPVPTAPAPQTTPQPDFRTLQALNNRLQRMLAEEGVAAWVEYGRGDGGTIFVQSGGSRNPGPNDPPAVPRVAIAIEHYGRIYRMLQKNVPVKIEADIRNTFYDNPELFNVVAEIPGTDKADEVVMLGAHFDSWHGGTGATDNAAGSAVMMEAVRILKASGVKMRRTVRIALWGGEEQGLLGSRAYAMKNFAEPSADRKTWVIKPGHAKLAGYFNVDNGTGKIRGVYLQGNDAVAPVFRAWMEPFANLGMTTLTIRNTGGTDHLAFDGVGLPGFQFIQDEAEYDSRTHHSNMDTYERIQEADMKQMAVIVASFVYNTANRAQLLPRKPMPPVPQAGGFGGGQGGPPPAASAAQPARPPQ